MHPVCAMLQTALRSLVDIKYAGNIRKAAKYLDIDYNLAYRIFHGQQKSFVFFDALRLVKALGISSDGSVLREYYPKEYADASSIKADDSVVEEFFEAWSWALSHPLHYEVLLYCSEIKNVSAEVVKAEYGAKGASALNDLIVKKAVQVREDGKLSTLLSQSHWTPIALGEKHAIANLGLLRLDAPGSYLRNQSAALNKEGIAELYRLYREFAIKAQAVEKDEKFYGTEIIVTGMYMGPISNNDRAGGV